MESLSVGRAHATHDVLLGRTSNPNTLLDDDDAEDEELLDELDELDDELELLDEPDEELELLDGLDDELELLDELEVDALELLDEVDELEEALLEDAATSADELPPPPPQAHKIRVDRTATALNNHPFNRNNSITHLAHTSARFLVGWNVQPSLSLQAKCTNRK